MNLTQEERRTLHLYLVAYWLTLLTTTLAIIGGSVLTWVLWETLYRDSMWPPWPAPLTLSLVCFGVAMLQFIAGRVRRLKLLSDAREVCSTDDQTPPSTLGRQSFESEDDP